jgi:hypothetical protein
MLMFYKIHELCRACTYVLWMPHRDFEAHLTFFKENKKMKLSCFFTVCNPLECLKCASKIFYVNFQKQSTPRSFRENIKINASAII